MDPDFSGGGEQNFEFAYNSIHFSDRVLRIEIVADPPQRKAEAQHWGFKGRKDDALMDIVTQNNESEPEQISINGDDSIHAAPYESKDGDGTDDEVACAIDTDCISEPSPVLRVESVCISSAILAAKSPSFYKLFSNGMQESDQRHATLRLHESEEAAFMDLLNYMYSNKLSTSSASGLLDVLMAADKFEVSSCVRHCCELLCNLPMTLESARLYLELPVSISMAFATQSLTDTVKKFLATHFRDITKFQEEIMHLPLAGFEAIISSDDIQVASEDALYDLVIKWTRFRYPKAEERRQVLGSLLDRYIRFPHMSCRKLKKVLTCSDVDHELASKAVLDALFFKAETPHQQRVLASEDPGNHRFTERTYKYRPVKIVDFESPYQQCIVYLDLKREECANLFPSGHVYSQAFHLGGQRFFFSAQCNTDQQSLFNCFGLYLGMQEKGSVSLMVDYEFAVRINPGCDFTNKHRGSFTFSGGKAVGYSNLFDVPWSSFMADKSPFFVNGMLHLRAGLTIKQPRQKQARQH